VLDTRSRHTATVYFNYRRQDVKAFHGLPTLPLPGPPPARSRSPPETDTWKVLPKARPCQRTAYCTLDKNSLPSLPGERRFFLILRRPGSHLSCALRRCCSIDSPRPCLRSRDTTERTISADGALASARIRDSGHLSGAINGELNGRRRSVRSDRAKRT